jgi:hypothetical protein
MFFGMTAKHLKYKICPKFKMHEKKTNIRG